MKGYLCIIYYVTLNEKAELLVPIITLSKPQQNRGKMNQILTNYLASVGVKTDASIETESDDIDPCGILGEDLPNFEYCKLANANFFNCFPDDFDDSDID